jgi:hypothetical protein
MIAGRVPVIGMSTFFISCERCRLPEGLQLAGLMRRMGASTGSVSLRSARGFVISSEEVGAKTASADDAVEVADYDPVRNSCLAIGPRAPSADTPIHWMAYRVDELTCAAAFVWNATRRNGVDYVVQNHPGGSFQEALEIVGLAKKSGRPAGAEGRGYLLRARSAEELLGLLRLMEPSLEKGAGT